MVAAAMYFQSQGFDQQTHDIHLVMIFTCIIAVALCLQAVGVFAAGLMASKMFGKLDALTQRLEAKATPIMDKANQIVTDLTPKIQSVSTNVEQISYTVREKVDEIGVTVSEINRTVIDINAKTRTHVDHVDGIVSDALATTADVSSTIQDSIRKPVRQIAGIVAGVKAGVETLVARSPFGKTRPEQNPYDL
jgi:ABC-type transporter Mla subunit MlaD